MTTQPFLQRQDGEEKRLWPFIKLPYTPTMCMLQEVWVMLTKRSVHPTKWYHLSDCHTHPEICWLTTQPFLQRHDGEDKKLWPFIKLPYTPTMCMLQEVRVMFTKRSVHPTKWYHLSQFILFSFVLAALPSAFWQSPGHKSVDLFIVNIFSWAVSTI